MGANAVVTTTVETAAVPTTTETVVATIPAQAVTIPPGGGIVVTCHFNFTTGSSTTQVIPRIRIGSVTGTALGANNVNTIGTAGQQNQFSIVGVDTSIAGQGQVTAGPYVLTVQQSAATTNGTVNNVNCKAEVVQSIL